MSCFLEVKGVTKKFAGMKALDKVDFSIEHGEVRALLGINGAGKSTLIKVLSGIYMKDEGEILIDGVPVRIEDPKDAIQLGISTVYQDPQTIPSMTGYENIYLGNESGSNFLFSLVNRRKLRQKAMDLLTEYPLEVDIDKPVFLLPAIEREIIAVLRALSRNCRVLILDEPTSILTEKEKFILFDLIRMLKSKGVAIIYITHHIDEVQQICDSYSVFRNGRDVVHAQIENGTVNVDNIVEAMLGESLSQLYPPKEKNPTNVEFSANGVVVGTKVNNVSFSAKKGEVLGIFGLVGSGIDELSKVMFGSMAHQCGEFFKRGEPIKLDNPKSVIDKGIFLVPGNRKEEGYLPGLSVAFNTTIAKIKKILHYGIQVIAKKENSDVQTLVDQMEIATPTIRKHVNELSGGNQQKVVVSKGLYTDADVYIFCEPTVGVDIGAKNKIYLTMRELCKRAAVILLSSEPEEIYGVADHIMVLYKGRVTMEKDDIDTSVKEMLVRAVIDE
jgi:ABC-type sugar transport system ATPase subunit